MSLSRTIVTSAMSFLFAVSIVSAADVDFVKEIQPILERTCLKCHGPEKPKGGLRLDTNEGLLKGAKDRKSVV